MADLRSALLAVADEADKMQKEITQLISHVYVLECENNKLRIKLKNAADCLSSIVNVLSED